MSYAHSSRAPIRTHKSLRDKDAINRLARESAMALLDLSKPPALDRAWAIDFVRCVSVLEPELPAIEAIEHAVAAHRVAWLLDPLEAADLWMKALRSQGWMVSSASFGRR
jgi:hypothetical protein